MLLMMFMKMMMLNDDDIRYDDDIDNIDFYDDDDDVYSIHCNGTPFIFCKNHMNMMKNSSLKLLV